MIFFKIFFLHEQSASNDKLHLQCKSCRKKFYDKNRYQLIDQQKKFSLESRSIKKQSEKLW